HAQELSCKHNFCVQCLAQYTGTLCPAPICAGTRSSDVIVDEMAGNTTTQIAFGSHTMSVLDLEDRQRCDARRGAFACVNVARMHLINCRHRICYDCLTEKIEQNVQNSKSDKHLWKAKIIKNLPIVPSQFSNKKTILLPYSFVSSYTNTKVPSQKPSDKKNMADW
uniref:RING-type domain-containing protein n=1 Tax=Angiostrongylus cantonensis TaxID=6313 RepID=A0A0K0CTX2_ANGCA